MPVAVIERVAVGLLALLASIVVFMPPAAGMPQVVLVAETELPNGDAQLNGIVEHQGEEYDFEAIIDQAISHPGRIKKVTIKRNKDSVSVEYEHDAPVAEIKDPSLGQVAKTLQNWLSKYKRQR